MSNRLNVPGTGGDTSGISLSLRRRSKANDFRSTISPKKLLCEAATNGNLAKLKTIIQQHNMSQDDVRRAKDSYGRSAVVLATMNGHLSVVQHLVMAGGSVNVCDNTGWSPLFWAARLGHLALVEYLCNHGARIETEDTFRNTAIIYAAHYEQDEIVQYLSSRDAAVTPEFFQRATPAIVDAYKRGQHFKSYQEEQREMEKGSIAHSVSQTVDAKQTLSAEQLKRKHIIDAECEILARTPKCGCRMGEGRKCFFFEAEQSAEFTNTTTPTTE